MFTVTVQKEEEKKRVHRSPIGFFFSSSPPPYHSFVLHSISTDLDIPAVSTAEQKSLIAPSVDSAMENSAALASTTNNASSLENTNWYDGSLETCIQQAAPISELREIPNDEILREVDINSVGDEFFLFSPRDSTDDEPSSRETIESPNQTSKRIFTLEESNVYDPFDFDNHMSSMMITNLDDLSIDDDDDENLSSERSRNGNYRRPIQEDILYEVEHENSFSDHSQNTSSIIVTEDKVSLPSVSIAGHFSASDSEQTRCKY